MKKWHNMIRVSGTGTLMAALLCMMGCRDAEHAGEETGEALEEAGEATKDAAEKMGDEMADAADEMNDEK